MDKIRRGGHQNFIESKCGKIDSLSSPLLMNKRIFIEGGREGAANNLACGGNAGSSLALLITVLGIVCSRDQSNFLINSVHICVFFFVIFNSILCNFFSII